MAAALCRKRQAHSGPAAANLACSIVYVLGESIFWVIRRFHTHDDGEIVRRVPGGESTVHAKAGAVANVGWNLFGAISGTMKLSDQALRQRAEQMAFVRVSASHRPFA